MAANSDDPIRPSNKLFERDKYTCQSCNRDPDEEPSVELTTYSLPPLGEGMNNGMTEQITICTECAELTTPFETPMDEAVDPLVDYLTGLFERYGFSETSDRFMELCEAASYIIPGIASDGGERIMRYKQKQRAVRFKLDAARNLADEVETVVNREMPNKFEEEYHGYVVTWRDWVTTTEAVIKHYDQIINVDEDDYSFYLHPNKGQLTNVLLQHKREWGEVNEEYREIVGEFFDLQHMKWSSCPDCNQKSSVWFKSEAIECAKCGARWEKTGWVRSRWEMIRGSETGAQNTLDGWGE